MPVQVWPPQTFTAIPAPVSSAPLGPYPVLVPLSAAERVDAAHASASPENRIVRAMESRTEALRAVINDLTAAFNALETYFLLRETSSMRANFDMGGKTVINLADGVVVSDGVTKQQLDALEASSVTAVTAIEAPRNLIDYADTLAQHSNGAGFGAGWEYAAATAVVVSNAIIGPSGTSVEGNRADHVRLQPSGAPTFRQPLAFLPSNLPTTFFFSAYLRVEDNLGAANVSFGLGLYATTTAKVTQSIPDDGAWHLVQATFNTNDPSELWIAGADVATREVYLDSLYLHGGVSVSAVYPPSSIDMPLRGVFNDWREFSAPAIRPPFLVASMLAHLDMGGQRITNATEPSVLSFVSPLHREDLSVLYVPASPDPGGWEYGASGDPNPPTFVAQNVVKGLRGSLTADRVKFPGFDTTFHSLYYYFPSSTSPAPTGQKVAISVGLRVADGLGDLQLTISGRDVLIADDGVMHRVSFSRDELELINPNRIQFFISNTILNTGTDREVYIDGLQVEYGDFASDYLGPSDLDGKHVAATKGTTAATVASYSAEFLPLDGTGVLTSDLLMGGFKITNVGLPVAGTDAASKQYVDDQILAAPTPAPAYDQGVTDFGGGVFGSAAYQAELMKSSIIPMGTLLPWCAQNGTSPPDGYVLCNGAEYAKTTYPEFFAYLTAGGPFGGNSRFSTLPVLGVPGFVVPDMRGCAAFGTHTKTIAADIGAMDSTAILGFFSSGWGAAPLQVSGTSSRLATQGIVVGFETKALTGGHTPLHYHEFEDAYTYSDLGFVPPTAAVQGFVDAGVFPLQDVFNKSTDPVNPLGGAAFSLMQPTLAVQFIMRVKP